MLVYKYTYFCWNLVWSEYVYIDIEMYTTVQKILGGKMFLK